MKAGSTGSPSDSEGQIRSDETTEVLDRGSLPEDTAHERGPSTLSQARSLQSRLGNMLAIGLIGSLTLGLVGWYYAKVLARPANLHHAARAAAQTQAEGDTAPPALGEGEPPAV